MILYDLRICKSDFKKKYCVSFAHLVYISSITGQHDVVVVCFLFTGFVPSKEEF